MRKLFQDEGSVTVLKTRLVRRQYIFLFFLLYCVHWMVQRSSGDGRNSKLFPRAVCPVSNSVRYDNFLSPLGLGGQSLHKTLSKYDR
jgi:hypothetical protein